MNVTTISKNTTGGQEALMFFNEAEAAALDAITARIMPSEPDELGAREAGVVTYIDRTVAGYFWELQGIYRLGLQQLDEHCRVSKGTSFADLAESEQDAVLLAIESSGAQTPTSGGTGAARIERGEDSALTQFFAVVREHTIQGMFCDPMYGGNRNFTGWRLIGFPGAQWGYSAEEMQEGFDATAIPILSLSDLRRVRSAANNG